MVLIGQAFLREKYPPHKKSLKQDKEGRYIELAFLTPKVGASYQELLDKLECQTLWRLKISPAVNQLALLSLARSLVEQKDGRVQKNSSFLAAQKKVRVTVAGPVLAQTTIEEEFFQETGFQLEIIIVS